MITPIGKSGAGMSAIVAGASFALSTLCVLAAPVFAESINVKYQGVVDLESYDCQSVTRSSLVHRVCYDDAKRQMIIELGSTYYAYCDIGSDRPRLVVRHHAPDPDKPQDELRAIRDARFMRSPRWRETGSMVAAACRQGRFQGAQ